MPLLRRPTWIDRWRRQDRGQDLIEYALLGAFLSLAVLTAAAGLGLSLNNWYGAFGSSVDAKSNCSAKGLERSGGVCDGSSANNAGGNRSGNRQGNGGGYGSGKKK